MFSGFNQQDFNVFQINGLSERMDALQKRIQPKFRELGEILSADLTLAVEKDMYLHIAKHARRTVNPPKDTWLAICDNKRGYKQHPHFQVGLCDDHAFIWLAYIYELPHKKQIAQKFLDSLDTVMDTIPDHYVISLDHMSKAATSMQEMNTEEFKAKLTRFRDVKKAEFLIGLHIAAEDPILQQGDAFLELVRETYDTLLPLYRLSLTSFSD